MPFMLTSEAFTEGEAIPSRYTCDGENLSPALAWSSVPPGAASLALVLDDPDAPGGVFTHWVLYNLPASTTQLPVGTASSAQLADGALQGTNDFGKTGYGGPCPPPGKPHHYRFTLYAVDRSLRLQAGASKEALITAMRGHVVGEARLLGMYQRRR